MASDLDLTELLRVFDATAHPHRGGRTRRLCRWGAGAALAADLIVAAELAKIGCVEAALGVNPLMGASNGSP